MLQKCERKGLSARKSEKKKMKQKINMRGEAKVNPELEGEKGECRK